MKKILMFLVLAAALSCSSDNENTYTVNKISFYVNGLTKVFTNVTVESNSPDMLVIYGQMGGSQIETLEIDIYKSTTGTSAVSAMTFTQNDVVYYGNSGTGLHTNVQENGLGRKVKGTFSGIFKTFSNNSIVLENGAFSISY